MLTMETEIDRVFETLVQEVEALVQAMYRGEVLQETVKHETDSQRRMARDAVLTILGVKAPAGDAGPEAVSDAALSPDEVAAISRCITGWLPMGDPSAAMPNSRCIPGAREIAPAWGEREKARLAIRRFVAG